jgi:hypothetical protein
MSDDPVGLPQLGSELELSSWAYDNLGNVEPEGEADHVKDRVGDVLRPGEVLFEAGLGSGEDCRQCRRPPGQ